MDLRSTISAVAKLPFDGDKLVEIICQTEPGAAFNPSDEEHSTFWIAVAHQFAKRGIDSKRAREQALGIIDSGSDAAMMEKLGMKPPQINKRRKLLAEVRTLIAEPPANDKPREVLKQPQPYIMEVGEMFAYPTCGGGCINPYFRSKELNKWAKGGSAPWEQDGWAAMVIVNRGRAFDFLTWYQPITTCSATPEKPTFDSLHGEVWRLPSPGTCRALHFKRMEFEKLGVVAIDEAKLKQAFPAMKSGISHAVNDITIANRLRVRPYVAPGTITAAGERPRMPVGKPSPTIRGLNEILRSDGGEPSGSTE
jgi:hypothetical protein